MNAVAELLGLKLRLEQQISGLTGELETISKTITILEREATQPSVSFFQEAGLSPAQPPAVGAQTSSGTGLTDRCLQLVDSEWITPATIRDRLLATGYHNTDKSKLLSSVYATLSRLAGAGRVESEKVDGRSVYRRPAASQAA